MPYIEQTKRNGLDPHIDKLHQELVNMESDDEQNEMERNVQYIFTRLIRKVYGSSSGELTDAIGVLERVKMLHCQTVGELIVNQNKFDNGDILPNNPPVFLDEIVINTNKEIK